MSPKYLFTSISGLLLAATISLGIKFLSSLNLIVLPSIFILKDLTFALNVGSLVFFSGFQMDVLPSILSLVTLVNVSHFLAYDSKTLLQIFLVKFFSDGVIDKV